MSEKFLPVSTDPLTDIAREMVTNIIEAHTRGHDVELVIERVSAQLAQFSREIHTGVLKSARIAAQNFMDSVERKA